MAHSLSAQKRIRQNAKHRARNRWRKDKLKTAVKAMDVAIHEGKKEDAPAKLKALYATLDQVAAKGVIHKNAASRKKARMARAMNKMLAGAAPTAPKA